MTFCIGIKVKEGLLGIADNRMTSGSEQTMARKVNIQQHGNHSLFLMTSGLRSVRDKAITYFNEVLEQNNEEFDKLYKAVNRFSQQIRRVSDEDKEALEESGLSFNLYSIVGGQLENDKEHKLYLIYPQANWMEIGEGSPYQIIGASSYGKPLCDRALKYETSMSMALKIAFLAFDATQQSSTDVGYPLDVVLYKQDSYQMVEHRYEEPDLRQVSKWWENRLRRSLDALPSDWLDEAFSKLYQLG